MEHPRGSTSPDRSPIHLAHPTRWPAIGVGLAAVLVGVALAWASAASATAEEEVVEEEALVSERAFEAAPSVEPQATRADGLPYRVDAFELSYAQDRPELPPIAEIMDLEIMLGKVAEGYVEPREGLPLLWIRLADVPRAGPEIYYGSAIRAIDKRIEEELARLGVAGMLVHPDEDDIDLGSHLDLRPLGRTAMGVVIREITPVPELAIEATPRVDETTGAGPPAVLPPVALPSQPLATPADGLPYRIDAFELSYAQDHPDHPPIAEIMALEIELGEAFDGYVLPREDLPLLRIRLADVPLAGPEIYYGSAIRTIDERIVEEFARLGLAGLIAHPDEDDIDLGSNRDLRPPGRMAMGIVIRHQGVEATTGDEAGAVLPPVALPGMPTATPADGLPYRIDAFELSYAQDHPDHPPIAEIMALEIELGEAFDGYVWPREDVPLLRIRLADVPLAGPEIYYRSAIRTIEERIVEEFAGRGLVGLLVHPDQDDMDLASNRDLRPPGRSAMGVVIGHEGVVARTAAVLPPVALPGPPAAMCSSNPELPTIPFEFDRAAITPQGAAVLDSLVDHLNLCENARIRIDGYTDEVGTDAYNRDLSERRAGSAHRYLIEAGISRGRLTARGLGEVDPMAPNATPEGRALNRRVELLRDE